MNDHENSRPMLDGNEEFSLFISFFF